MDSFFNLSNVSFVFEMFRTAYDGVEWFLAAYLVCLAGFFIVGREYLTAGFLYPLLFMLLTIFNPFLIVPIAEKINLSTRFRRLFWLIPVNLVLAYCFTVLASLPSRKGLRGLVGLVCAAFVVLLGASMKPYLKMPQNIYKTSNEIMTISSIIAEDSERTGTDRAALYSSQYLLELRQFDPSIRSILRRKDLLDWEIDPTDEEAVQGVLDSGHHLHTLALVSRYGIRIDRETFLKSARRCNAHYIITDTELNLGDYFTGAGYEKIGEAGIFEVYRAADTMEQGA